MLETILAGGRIRLGESRGSEEGWLGVLGEHVVSIRRPVRVVEISTCAKDFDIAHDINSTRECREQKESNEKDVFCWGTSPTSE